MSETPKPTPMTDALFPQDCEDFQQTRKLADLCRQLERELQEARAEIERLDWSGIHSCHAECQRPMCVLRRELAEAKVEIERLTKWTTVNGVLAIMEELSEAREQRDEWEKENMLNLANLE